jgi:predicted phage tail protein
VFVHGFIIFTIVDASLNLSSIQVTTHTATALTVNWTASGDIDQFEITYSYTVNSCSENGGPVMVNITDGLMRSYTLDNLNEDSRYTITVRAINIVGSTMATTSADTLISGNADYVIVLCMH